MNNFFKQMNVFVLCAMVATVVPVYSMENMDTVANDEVEVIIEEIVEQKPATAWYKKPSVQLAAAAITTAMAVYAYAVHTARISMPVLWVNLLGTKDIIQNNTSNSDASSNDNGNSENNDNKEVIVEKNIQNDAQQQDNVINNNINSLGSKVLNATDQIIVSSKKLGIGIKNFFDRCLKTSSEVTPEEIRTAVE